MNILCLDLEGLLVPEIWVVFAEKTGIDALRATTRDIPDYDELMQFRLDVLAQHNLHIGDVIAVIDTIDPLAGATDFLVWARTQFQPVIVSDTFYEFAMPLMKKLGNPMLLCHTLSVDAKGVVDGYMIRQKDPKRRVVEGFQKMNFRVLASGDSYNDVSMLQQADFGIFFSAPDNVKQDFPQFDVAKDYNALQKALIEGAASFSSAQTT